MNPIQAIDELILKAHEALEEAEESTAEDAVEEIWKQQEAVQTRKLVRAMQR